MNKPMTFDKRMNANLGRLSRAEQQVARFFQENREEVLVASASALASKTGTSDATVVRTTRALGYSGMEELRRQLADELRENLSPASRLTRTLSEVGDDPKSIFETTLDIHLKALEDLRQDMDAELFQSAIEYLVAARRIFIFGIGPSSALADYFAIQLGRFGLVGQSLTQTGLLLADGLLRLSRGDLVIILAYSRVYRELATLLEHTSKLGISTMLLTDTLGPILRDRVDLVLPVARGRADALSMHTATLGLIEALLVGIAARRPADTLSNLKLLNHLRARLVGEAMDLPIPEKPRAVKPSRRRNQTRSKSRAAK